MRVLLIGHILLRTVGIIQCQSYSRRSFVKHHGNFFAEPVFETWKQSKLLNEHAMHLHLNAFKVPQPNLGKYDT